MTADHLNNIEQFGFFRTFGEADGEIFRRMPLAFLEGGLVISIER
jgi:hypothetical protein